jgi:hypothetical protein
MNDLVLNSRKVNAVMRHVRKFFHDIKERMKARRSSEPIGGREEESDEPACPDWIRTTEGEHFARKKDSFTPGTYYTLPAKSTAGEKLQRERRGLGRLFHSAPRGRRNKVIGIGDVELTVKRRTSNYDLTTSSLKLKDVLHLPDSPCNGFNPGEIPGCRTTESGSGTSQFIQGFENQGCEAIGYPWWHAKPFHGTMRLVLAADPLGRSVFKKVPPNGLNVVLNEGEKDIIYGAKERGRAGTAPVAVDEPKGHVGGEGPASE